MVNTPFGVKMIRTVLLCAVFHLVAKAPALNMKQFNGYNGCPTCLHPGLYYGHCMTYPPDSYPLQTHASVLRNAQKAESSHSVVKGIYGNSVLSTCLDVVDADRLHALCPGWCDKVALCPGWCDKVASALLDEQPPHNFTRAPRSLANHLNYWKASKFRT